LSAFTFVGFIEPFDLICSLKGRMGLFAGTGLRTLHLRGPRKGGDGEDYVDTRELSRWPEVRAVLQRVEAFCKKRFSADIEFGRVYLEMLDPGTAAPTRSARNHYGFSHLRLVLALRANPGAYLWCPPDQLVLTAGQLVLTGPALWHGAVNMGEYSRINLVVDIKTGAPGVPSPIEEPEVLDDEPMPGEQQQTHH
jgi:hypothetical protein